MPTDPKEGNPAVDALGKVLATLAARVTDPSIAAVLVVVIVVAIVVAFAFGGSVPGLILLGVVAVSAILFIAWVRRETNKVARSATVELADTIGLASALDDEARIQIRTALAQAAAETASVLGIAIASVRCNVFGMARDKKLSIIHDFTYHMDRPEELTLPLDVGQGSTGLAFANGRPNIAVLRADWGDATIPDELLAKIHPDLRWVVSVPVFAGEPTPRPVWVLNVDGLGSTPELGLLQEVLGRMVFYAQAIALILARSIDQQGATT